jgi:hypothetical protein
MKTIFRYYSYFISYFITFYFLTKQYRKVCLSDSHSTSTPFESWHEQSSVTLLNPENYVVATQDVHQIPSVLLLYKSLSHLSAAPGLQNFIWKFPLKRFPWIRSCNLLPKLVSRVVQSVQRLTSGLTVRGSNPDWGEIFRTCPDRPWGPPSLLYNGYRVFPGGRKRPGREADPSPPSSAEVYKQSRAITLLSLRAFVACKNGETYLMLKMFLKRKLLQLT